MKASVSKSICVVSVCKRVRASESSCGRASVCKSLCLCVKGTVCENCVKPRVQNQISVCKGVCACKGVCS